jgi:hypothetical protein
MLAFLMTASLLASTDLALGAPAGHSAGHLPQSARLDQRQETDDRLAVRRATGDASFTTVPDGVQLPGVQQVKWTSNVVGSGLIQLNLHRVTSKKQCMPGTNIACWTPASTVSVGYWTTDLAHSDCRGSSGPCAWGMIVDESFARTGTDYIIRLGVSGDECTRSVDTNNCPTTQMFRFSENTCSGQSKSKCGCQDGCGWCSFENAPSASECYEGDAADPSGFSCDTNGWNAECAVDADESSSNSASGCSAGCIAGSVVAAFVAFAIVITICVVMANSNSDDSNDDVAHHTTTLGLYDSTHTTEQGQPSPLPTTSSTASQLPTGADKGSSFQDKVETVMDVGETVQDIVGEETVHEVLSEALEATGAKEEAASAAASVAQELLCVIV